MKQFSRSADGDLTVNDPTKLAVAVTPRVLGGVTYLSVSVTNQFARPVDIVVTTAYGAKVFSNVAPGKSVSASANSKLAAVPAGEVTVSATSTGVSTVKDVPYSAFSVDR